MSELLPLLPSGVFLIESVYEDEDKDSLRLYTQSPRRKDHLGFQRSNPIYRFYHDWLESLYLRLITPSPDFSSPSPVSSASELLVWTFGSLDFRCFLAVFEVHFSATTPVFSAFDYLEFLIYERAFSALVGVATLGAFVKA